MRFYVKENGRLHEKYFRGVHESGLQIVLIPKEHKKAFALFGTRYGSIHRTFKTASDSDFITVPDGIAHFLEHKLFENEDGSDSFARFAALGANCNAFTSNEMTAYLFSATENYYENLEVLLDFVTHPYFTPETVKKEMGIIGQEIRMCEDEPFHALYYGLLDAMYRDHNVKVNVAGTEETISHITSDILYRCYHTFYNLRNMQLVLCGAWDKRKVAAVCDKILEKSEKCPVECRFPREGKRLNYKKSVKTAPVAIPLFAVGLKERDLPKRTSSEGILKKEAQHEILADILFGKSSALYNDLYEKGLVNDKFSVEYELSRTYGYLYLSGESRYPDKVFRAIRRAVENAAEEITAENLERSRRAVYARAIQDWNSTSGIAESFMAFSFAGADMSDYPDAVAKVTLDDLLNRIRLSYHPRLLALSVVKPHKGGKTK